MELIRQAIGKILRVYRSDLDWETKYGVVFRLSGELKYLLGVYGLSIHWHDPDTSYQEDVTAYVNAIIEMLPEIEKLERVLQE